MGVKLSMFAVESDPRICEPGEVVFREYDMGAEMYVDWEKRTYKPLSAQALPNQTFYTPGKMTVGNERIEYGHLGQAHTDGICRNRARRIPDEARGRARALRCAQHQRFARSFELLRSVATPL